MSHAERFKCQRQQHICLIPIRDKRIVYFWLRYGLSYNVGCDPMHLERLVECTRDRLFTYVKPLFRNALPQDEHFTIIVRVNAGLPLMDPSPVKSETIPEQQIANHRVNYFVTKMY